MSYEDRDRPRYARPTLPARSTHGALWWATVGWWWAPTYWLCRVTVWLIFWPLGLWWSILHSRGKKEQRLRRGYEQAEREERQSRQR